MYKSMQTKLIILLKYCFSAVMLLCAFKVKLITLLMLGWIQEVVLLVHFPVPIAKPFFTGSTTSCAYHKGIFLFDFVKSNSVQNCKPLP